MARPKRVSMKGRGADLFFDGAPSPLDASDTVTDVGQPAGADEVDQVEPNTVTQQSKQPTKQATNKASNQARSSDEPQPQAMASQAANPVADVALELVWDAVAEPATLATTFRYTEEELSRLVDVLYELTKGTRTEVSKQDIARIGLNVVLWDYEARGDASLLAQYAARRRSRR